MADGTGIQWTDATWNPVRGCSRVSEGCRNCYAEGVAKRFSGPGQPYEGLADPRRSGSKWTGVVKLVASALDQPFRWRRQRRIFVNSMSDLFHESLSDVAIDQVFGVMHACEFFWRGDEVVEGHVFQVLTKRAARMVEYLSKDRRKEWAYWGAQVGGGRDPDGLHDQIAFRSSIHPRIWLGVSVEDQKSADERIPLLLRTPAAIRFLSMEPLIGPVNMYSFENAALDWIIVGGESGPRARPFDLDWARHILKWAGQLGIACFMKQLGAQPQQGGTDAWKHGSLEFISDKKGGDIDEWPADLRVRQFPEAT